MSVKYLDATGLARFWSGIKSKIASMISAEAGKMIPYGYCSTAAKTVAKTVTVNPAVTELTAGLTIAVKFQYANGVANPTLNVNGLGAKSIKRYGTTAPSTSAASSWNANEVRLLTYDGSYWQLCDWLNSTYSNMSVAEYEAGTSATARLISPVYLKNAIDHWSPSKTSDLTNDSGFITSAPVDSVNGKTGAVVLSASDVGAVPATMCQATGAAGTPSMSAGSYAQIVLISSSAIMVGDGFSITSDGGIKCTSAGTYKVSGSIFMGVNASGGATLKEAYISKGTTYNNSSRVVSGADSMYVGDGKAREGAVPIGGKLVQASAGDAFYLYCRIFDGAGYCSNANKDTFLLVEKVA